MEPYDAGVVLEPRHLLFGIDTCVLLHAFYGHGQFPCAVEDIEHFLVAYGVQGIVVAVWQELMRSAIEDNIMTRPMLYRRSITKRYYETLQEHLSDEIIKDLFIFNTDENDDEK